MKDGNAYLVVITTNRQRRQRHGRVTMASALELATLTLERHHREGRAHPAAIIMESAAITTPWQHVLHMFYNNNAALCVRPAKEVTQWKCSHG